MITVDGKQYFLKDELKPAINGDKGDKAHTFLSVGLPYAFRTVTMIYTGRLVAVSEQEFLVEEAAWIPETERWMDFAATGAVKECEPYTKPIIINRGAILDVTEIPNVLTKQK